MDVLSDILSHLEIKTCVYFRTCFTAPWGVLVPECRSVARFHIVLNGSLYISANKREYIKACPGDILLIPNGQAHSMQDQCGSTVKPLDDIIKEVSYKQGDALIYGASGGAETQLFCGHFEFKENYTHPLLRSYPNIIHIKKTQQQNFNWLDAVSDIVNSESTQCDPGSELILNKLSEITLIQILRYYMKHSQTNTLYLSALNDPYIGKSIEHIHADPFNKWTLEQLAHAVGLSRTVYCERFYKLTGTTPVSYLIMWRMEKAKKLLKDNKMSIEKIAELSGYAASESFQKAFKKCIGLTPSKYRKQYAAYNSTNKD